MTKCQDGKLDQTFVNYEISHATLRTEDLIPTFCNFLAQHAFRAYGQLIAECLRLKTVNKPGYGEYYADENEADYLLNERLFDALNDIAPEGTFFGSHEGNTSSFGFWPIEDEDELPIIEELRQAITGQIVDWAAETFTEAASEQECQKLSNSIIMFLDAHGYIMFPMEETE